MGQPMWESLLAHQLRLCVPDGDRIRRLGASLAHLFFTGASLDNGVNNKRKRIRMLRTGVEPSAPDADSGSLLLFQRLTFVSTLELQGSMCYVRRSIKTYKRRMHRHLSLSL